MSQPRKKHHVDTVYVIAVLTSLNRGAGVLRLRTVEPCATGEHARIHNAPDEPPPGQSQS